LKKSVATAVFPTTCTFPAGIAAMGSAAAPKSTRSHGASNAANFPVLVSEAFSPFMLSMEYLIWSFLTFMLAGSFPEAEA
jgi:hypothetical protein